MLSLMFGLAAALAWAVHDLQVRKLTQESAILPMIITVLGSGTIALLIPAMFSGEWGALNTRAVMLALGSGVAYLIGAGGLYQALSRAPVKIVAPLMGAYPLLSLGIAAVQGHEVSGMEWLAVGTIVVGISWVAMTGRDGGALSRGSLSVALIWAVVGAIGFAATFAFGQEAARQSAEIPVMVITRVSALMGAVLLGLAYRSIVPPRGAMPVLCGMGELDATALGLVTASASLPNPEYASVAAALFGVLTILLAWRFLGERVAALQWVGITAVFGGIAVLSMSA